jgi:hypothetical protein
MGEERPACSFASKSTPRWSSRQRLSRQVAEQHQHVGDRSEDTVLVVSRLQQRFELTSSRSPFSPLLLADAIASVLTQFPTDLGSLHEASKLGRLTQETVGLP